MDMRGSLQNRLSQVTMDEYFNFFAFFIALL